MQILTKSEDTRNILESVCLTCSDTEIKAFATSIAPAMRTLMIESNGVGIAAPQVGIKKRLFVLNAPFLKWFFFNPEVLEQSSKTDSKIEECLSYPWMSKYVTRPRAILVRYNDETGSEIIRELTGYEARVFQHELEHLDWITLINK